METALHIAALERDGALLVEAARSGDLDAPVPACPEWKLRDLLAHVGYVHRWAASYVSSGKEEMAEGDDEASILAAAPPDPELVEWVAVGHAALVGALSEAPDDLSCWTFLPAASPLSFWARRQAHETAVHRVDAEQTAGTPPSPIEPRFAADGIDEMLAGFLGRRREEREAKPLLGKILLDPTDSRDLWTCRVLSDDVSAVPSKEDADLVVRAPSADLYLLVWNRRGTEDLDLDGEADLLTSWKERLQLTWQ